jgi:DNA-binding transcriptional MerR regulator
LKLKELIKATDVSRETIQFYLRDGILPKPRKRNGAQADYNESYVNLIKLIKDLQENHFLPLNVIKKIIRQIHKASPEKEQFFRLQSELFNPVNQVLSKQEISGEEAFCKETGLGPKWLANAESWGIITPRIVDNQKNYDFEDIAIGKIMVEMDHAGFGPKDGFNPETLKHYRDALETVVSKFNHRFTDLYFGKVPKEEFSELGTSSLNLTGIYFYFIYRKLAKQNTQNYIRELEQREVLADT